MKHIENKNIYQDKHSVVTLGNFDGVHLGHRELIRNTNEIANRLGLQSVLFTFDYHPKLIFGANNEFSLITSKKERIRTVEALGIDVYIEYPFTKEFAKMSPEEFFNNILVDELKCKALIVGFDYHFGANRAGNLETLKKLGTENDIEVIGIPSVDYEGERISSTRIRHLLREGNFKSIEDMLTKPYSIVGVIEKGKQIGRTIGFPTANLSAIENKAFPENGVYATKTFLNGKYYYSITNVGTNPTVSEDGSVKTIETNLFDFNDEVYGSEIEVFFYKFIRKERPFPSLDALKDEIAKNLIEVKDFFEIN